MGITGAHEAFLKLAVWDSEARADNHLPRNSQFKWTRILSHHTYYPAEQHEWPLQSKPDQWPWTWLSHETTTSCLLAQSCPTLSNPMDRSPPGASVHGTFQARILEWVAIPSPGDLPDPGIKPRSPALQADALPSESPTWRGYKVKTCSRYFPKITNCFVAAQLCMHYEQIK